MMHGILAIQEDLVVSDFDSPDHRAAVWKIGGGRIDALKENVAVHLAEQRHDFPVAAASRVPDHFTHRYETAVQHPGGDCAHFGERYGGRAVFAVVEQNHLVRRIREAWNTRVRISDPLGDDTPALVARLSRSSGSGETSGEDYCRSHPRSASRLRRHTLTEPGGLRRGLDAELDPHHEIRQCRRDFRWIKDAVTVAIDTSLHEQLRLACCRDEVVIGGLVEARCDRIA